MPLNSEITSQSKGRNAKNNFMLYSRAVPGVTLPSPHCSWTWMYEWLDVWMAGWTNVLFCRCLSAVIQQVHLLL